jgi:hypothetical protein
MDFNVGAIAADTAQIVGFVGVEVDKIKTVKGGVTFKARVGLPSTGSLVVLET